MRAGSAWPFSRIHNSGRSLFLWLWSLPSKMKLRRCGVRSLNLRLKSLKTAAATLPELRVMK